jgi:hypothetical protein
MKNHTAPRTMADAQFVTGYSSIDALHRAAALPERLIGYGCAAFAGYLLAALIYGG